MCEPLTPDKGSFSRYWNHSYQGLRGRSQEKTNSISTSNQGYWWQWPADSAISPDNLHFLPIWEGGRHCYRRELDLGQDWKMVECGRRVPRPWKVLMEAHSFDTSFRCHLICFPGAPWLPERTARCIPKKGKAKGGKQEACNVCPVSQREMFAKQIWPTGHQLMTSPSDSNFLTTRKKGGQRGEVP